MPTPSPSPILAGFDLGTSTIKGVLVTAGGEILATATAPTALVSPLPGRYELDADGFVSSVFGILREMTAHLAPGQHVAAVSFAAASGNTVLIGADNRPLTPVINWMDMRGEEAPLPALEALDQSGVHAVTGWPCLKMFPLAHLAWFKQHQPELYQQAARYSMDTIYLLYRLTGRWGIDLSTATPFYLVDQVRGRWHQPYLDALDIPESKLAALAPSGTVLGTVTQEAAAQTGLTVDTQVVLGSFDHPAAARCTATLNPGSLMLSCGTSWVGFYPALDRARIVAMNMLSDPFLQPTGPWGAMFSMPCIGNAINTLVETATGAAKDSPDGAKFARFAELAAAAAPGAGGCAVNLLKPPADAAALLRHFGPQNLSRAVMEAAAFHMRAKIAELTAAGWAPHRITMVGGPSRSEVWTQIIADITGLPLTLNARQHAGALGAAILAGIGAGVFADARAGAAALARDAVHVTPDPARHAQYAPLFAAWQQSA